MGYGIHSHVESTERFTETSRVLWGVLFLNLAVAAAKLGYGTWSGSVAMVADGYHSLFDGVSNIVGLVGISVARRPADESHPYGHGKFETWASVGIGILLVFAAWGVVREAVLKLLGGGEAARVDVGSFVVMGVTLLINVGVSLYERRVGRRLGSEVLLADASHTASDALVSLGVIGGLILVAAGYPLADPLIALAVAVMILRAALKILKRAGDTLSDRARIPDERICDVTCEVDGVLGCHDIRTRGSLSEVYVDLHVQVDEAASLREAHDVAERVERALFGSFGEIADVIVHVEPMDDYQARKTSDQPGGRLV